LNTPGNRHFPLYLAEQTQGYMLSREVLKLKNNNGKYSYKLTRKLTIHNFFFMQYNHHEYMKFINHFAAWSWFHRLKFGQKIAVLTVLISFFTLSFSVTEFLINKKSTTQSTGIRIQSPNVNIKGDNPKSEINYNNNIIKGVDPRDIETNLNKLKTKTKQERLQEVEQWYKNKEIDPSMKEALSVVIDHIDKDLQASQQEIVKLRAEGKDQLAAVLEKLNEAFANSDIDKMLAIRDEEVGKLNKDEAIVYLNVADKLGGVFRFKEAEENYKKAIELQKKAGMTENSDYATSLNNLAGLYKAQGKYDLAEPLYQEALRIFEKVFGDKDYPEYATSLNNLALLYSDQGKYEQAESRYLEALEIKKKVLGTDNPSYAISLNNLALLYKKQGKYDLAESRYLEALRIEEKVLGKEHPDYTTSLDNLAGLYHAQGKYDLAEPLYQEALKLDEKVLGKDHPNYAGDLNNLAVLYRDQGKYDQAKSLYQEALKIDEKVLGTDHPTTKIIRDNLNSLP
jgi:tetratricopeptide (TPR) repeat protein